MLERQLAPASVRLFYCGIRCLYLHVLAWPAVELEVALSQRPQRIPGLLTRAEVAAILSAGEDPRYRTMLAVAYGGGLRLNEVLALRVKTATASANSCASSKARAPRTAWCRSPRPGCSAMSLS